VIYLFIFMFMKQGDLFIHFYIYEARYRTSRGFEIHFILFVGSL